MKHQHHDDEMSAAEALAIFNKAAGIAEPAPLASSETNAAALPADDEAVEAYADAALATFARAAAAFGGMPQAAPEPSRQIAARPAAAAGHFGDGIASDLAKVSALLERMEASCAPVPAPDPLSAWLERARSAPAAEPTAQAAPKPAPLAELPYEVRAVLASRAARARLPEATRAKLAATEAQTMLATLQQQMTAKHGAHRTGPDGEPLGAWIAATYVQEVAKIHTWESTTGKRLPDNVIPAHRAAQFTFQIVNAHLARQAKAAA